MTTIKSKNYLSPVLRSETPSSVISPIQIPRLKRGSVTPFSIQIDLVSHREHPGRREKKPPDAMRRGAGTGALRTPPGDLEAFFQGKQFQPRRTA
ncbi:MAG: hypothetical protein CMJ23_04325 [Phycisphaerae bacterium]|nr:hypothetical protein [Phycisphaerae bacterium]